MATYDEVSQFLDDFKTKMNVFQIIFRDDRIKNAQTLLDLDIIPEQRKEIITALVPEDYSEGPLDDKLYGINSMWVFGPLFKEKEIYVKISMGRENDRVICISFHLAEIRMNHPFKI
jgi:hypothetical protein